LSARIKAVWARIAAAEAAAGRAGGAVRLLAVSKTFPAEAVAEAAACGLTAFGENYAQEGVDKIAALRASHPGLALEWHFIGPLQSNKTRQVAEHFDWVQSIEREKIAARLSAQRPAGRPALEVLVQVNVSGEASKSGVAPEQALALAQAVAALPRLRLRGLMAIPEPDADPALARARLARMRDLFEALRAVQPGVDTLSLGMSADLEDAIAAGSTLVRVGTAIFGARGPLAAA
jgi:pyridoxal phosphate enzyme (YggS family)